MTRWSDHPITRSFSVPPCFRDEFVFDFRASISHSFNIIGVLWLSKMAWATQGPLGGGEPGHRQSAGEFALQGNQKIFVVEDDLDIARLVRHHLESTGFRVRSYSGTANVLPARKWLDSPQDFFIFGHILSIPYRDLKHFQDFKHFKIKSFIF